MKIAIEINRWNKLFDLCWPEVRNTLREIERQGRQEEALEYLERVFNPYVWGHMPNEREFNNYIFFKLPDIMHLYDKPNTRQ